MRSRLVGQVGHGVLGAVTVTAGTLAVTGGPGRPGRAVDGRISLARSLDHAAQLPAVGQVGPEATPWSCRPVVPWPEHTEAPGMPPHRATGQRPKCIRIMAVNAPRKAMWST